MVIYFLSGFRQLKPKLDIYNGFTFV